MHRAGSVLPSWCGARARKLRFTPLPPLLSQLGSGKADGLFQNFEIEDAFGAKVAESLLGFAPRDQEAMRVCIAQKHGPDDAAGYLAIRRAIVEPRLSPLPDRPPEGTGIEP